MGPISRKEEETGGEERGKGRGGREGGCVMAVGGWTPLKIIRLLV